MCAFAARRSRPWSATRPTIAAIRDERNADRMGKTAAAVPASTPRCAEAPKALHATHPDNVLIRGRVARGDVDAGFATAAAVAEGAFETSFVEHAYIEPEAGYARRVGDRIEIFACTQTPYMDRDEIALILGLQPTQVRIVPSAVGGGFGGKLDLSLQPLIATAAWMLDRPVRCVYTRPESMAATTKRHPARINARFACDRDGRSSAVEFHGDFNTGAYASWGPTVANRVPVHAMGPYAVGGGALHLGARSTPTTRRRRVPRLRRAAGGDRARDADGRARRDSSASIRSSSGCATRCARAPTPRPGRRL